MKLGNFLLLFMLVIAFSSFISADCLSDCKSKCYSDYGICLSDCRNELDQQTCITDCKLEEDNCFLDCEISCEDNPNPQGNPPENSQGEPKDQGLGFSITNNNLFNRDIYIRPFIFGVLKDNTSNILMLETDYNLTSPKFYDVLKNENYALSQKFTQNNLFIFYLNNSSPDIVNNFYLANYYNLYNFNMKFESINYGTRDLSFYFELNK
jgi:hypothetical protein